MSRIKYFFVIALAFLICRCQTNQQIEETPQSVGLDLSLMDTTANPKNDFYQYANGGWLTNTEIPSDQSKWGAFNELIESTNQNVLQMLEEAIASDQYAADTDQGKAVTFFQVAMDTTHLDQLGLAPIGPELSKIENIQSLEELVQYLIDSAPLSSNAFFGFGASPDLNNSEINAGFIQTAALGLPGKEYYTNDDDETLRIQGEYKSYVTKALQLTGQDEGTATATAERIFLLEQKMAETKMDKIQKRNPLLRNNPRSQDDIAAMTPSFDWKKYFESIGLGAVDTFIVSEPAFIKSLEPIFNESSIEDLKAYTSWTLFNSTLPYLSSEYEKVRFDFYDGVLAGVQEMKPREERVLSIINFTIGEALGRLYVDSYFPPEAKEVAEELVRNLKKGFSDRIDQLEWMSDSTKTKAKEKLATLRVKIGYPDKWKDFSEFQVKSKKEGGSYAGNMMLLSEWMWKRTIKKIGNTVDKEEWFMPPQMVNAYYHPLYNEVVFPAAILQPPYYDYQADAAVNYGGFGAVIGHEISHAFDDQGSRYDAKGNLANWWTDEDRQNFEVRTQKLIDQFNKYEPLPELFVNGAFTLGENIGDLGGLNVSYDGLQHHLKANGDPGLIDGYTQNQRFFLSWATVWRTLFTDEAMKKQIKTNVHSPGKYRAIGPIVNMPAFYEAFEIQEGDGMFVTDSLRVSIW